jgi:hypothetical protein
VNFDAIAHDGSPSFKILILSSIRIVAALEAILSKIDIYPIVLYKAPNKIFLSPLAYLQIASFSTPKPHLPGNPIPSKTSLLDKPFSVTTNGDKTMKD